MGNLNDKRVFLFQKTHLKMDRRGWKMSKKYECQQCGATFNKLGLLADHRRYLGHCDTFECNICPKKFSRKDNLDRHLQRHSNSKNHQCEECNTVFSRPDSLQRHIQHKHNQYGGSNSKRQLDISGSAGSQTPKRQKTEKRDSNEYYDLSVLRQRYISKFRTTSTN